MHRPPEPAPAADVSGGDIDARATAELAARTSYGRLVAYLGTRWRDLAAAEDALGDMLLAALEAWPRLGVPDKPEAWLLAVARRRLIDAARHANVELAASADLVERAHEATSDEDVFPDDRLKLLFVCAHPAIHESARTPLMLQTVLGLDAARIASAFLEGLIRIAPAIGAYVGYAAALAEVAGAEAGLAVLDDIRAEPVKSYQPYWAARAHLLKRLRLVEEAEQAYARAIGLSEDPAVREFLASRSEALSTD